MRYQVRTREEYAVKCRCGENGPWALSREEARDLAEEAGWRLGNGEALCPECRKAREAREEALAFLVRDPLLKEAYRYAYSFPGDAQTVERTFEVDGLPRYVLYFWYLARRGIWDVQRSGVSVFRVQASEQTLFPGLEENIVAVWEENNRLEYRTGWDVETVIYGELPP